jgi:hypothetical protein
MPEDPDNASVFIKATFWMLPIFKIFMDTEGCQNFLHLNKVPQIGLISGYKLLIRRKLNEYLLLFERDKLQ